METEFGVLTKDHRQLLSETQYEQYNLTMNYNNFELMRNFEKRKSSKILLFFHGNAEDLGIAYRVLNQMKQSLKMTILAIEYSGYGLFVGEKSAEKVLDDCLSVYDFITNELGVAH
jgi:hypothetical protein